MMDQATALRGPARILALAGFFFLLCILTFSKPPPAYSDDETQTPTLHPTEDQTPTISPTTIHTTTATPHPTLTDTPTYTGTPTIPPSTTPTAIPSPSATATFPITTTPSVTPSPSPSHTPTPSVTTTPPITTTPSVTPSPSPSHTPTSSATPSPSPSPTATQTPTSPATPYPPHSILINELAWAGTLASANDEWIELYNASGNTIHLSGWTLTDGGDIHIALRGSIPAHGYYLLERTDDTTISDLAANMIYTGSLRNGGESLWLKDPSAAIVDSANQGGGAWPAGSSASRSSMERRGIADQPGNWKTFSGIEPHGHDAAGNPIQGTPRNPNSPPPPTPTPTATLEATATPTPTIDPERTPTPFAPQSVLINEIAWAGTIASSSDEWIELYNPNAQPIPLENWILTDGNDILINLTGTLPGHGYLLLERTDDSTIANIPANLIFTGGLKNSGETLLLKDPTGHTVDSANSGGRGWFAGRASSRASMERRGGFDQRCNWGTFSGYHQVGLDAFGNPIQGTPGRTNSVLLPTPVPTYIPGRIRINEVLIRPHYDWEGKGGVNTGDEFIELYNLGPGKVFLKGWILDDEEDGGSKPHKLPGVTLGPGKYVAFYKTRTGIALNDSGDTVRLLAPDGTLIEEIHYLRVSAYNLSYGRLPDGSGHLVYGLWPTPNEANLLYEEPFIPVTGELFVQCPVEGGPSLFLMRHVRHPARARWMKSEGYSICD